MFNDDVPLLEQLEFTAIEFFPMDHPMYAFATGDPGEQSLFRLPNGLHISIVRHRLSYGGDRGQYEIMVLGRDATGSGMGVTGVTDQDGIIGYLEPRAVTDALVQLAGANL
jgi:hypothetical protein